jgi:replication-associated recombination protein RarA
MTVGRIAKLAELEAVLHQFATDARAALTRLELLCDSAGADADDITERLKSLIFDEDE